MKNRLFVAAFTVSASALALQLTFTRILSVLYWQHLVYAILTTSLLGFAASGTALHFSRRLRALDTLAFLRFCLSGFALSSLWSVAAATWFAGDFFVLRASSFGGLNILRLAGSYLASTVPFFFFGLLVLGLFQRQPHRSGSLYAANLFGSALGSLLYSVGILPFGALGVLRGFVFIPTALLAALLGADRRPISIPLATALVAMLLLSIGIQITPDRHKQYWTLVPEKEIEVSEWNPLSRVDVLRSTITGQRRLLIDGDAQAPLFPPQDALLKEIRWERLRPPPGPIAIPTSGWRGLTALVRVKPGNGPIELALESGGTRVAHTIEVSSGKTANLLVSWSPERGRSVLYSKYLPVEFRGWRPASLGVEGRLTVSSGVVEGVQAWDRALDSSEVLAAGPGVIGLERFVGHKVFKEEAGRDEGHVLVIGNGGGADSIAAALARAKWITAVEVNPTSYYLTKVRYSDYLRGFFQRPNVRLWLEDGRSFVRRSKDRYDLINLVGVDSFAAASSGAYVLTESYLYTSEALSDYWDHLTEDGKLQISRWHFPKRPRETFRLFTMAYEMLASRGVADPARHLSVVTAATDATDEGFATLILSKRPLSPRSLALFQRGFGAPLNVLYHPLQEAAPTGNAFGEFVAAARSGNAEAFYRSYPFNVRPVSDDNPFFFQYGKWSHLFSPYAKEEGAFHSILGRWPFFVLALLLFQCVVFGLVLLIPIYRDVGAASGRVRCVGYFGTLGLAFMFVEMALIQKLVLLLGHPMFSLGITLPTLLGAAGLGSFVSKRLDLSESPWVFGGIVLTLVLFTLEAPVLLHEALALEFPLRALLAAALVLPVGFCLGIPFPGGLRLLPTRLVPLAWAANGVFTVLASVAAVLVAMRGGFSAVLLTAAALYGLCGWLVPAAAAERSVPEGSATIP